MFSGDCHNKSLVRFFKNIYITSEGEKSQFNIKFFREGSDRKTRDLRTKINDLSNEIVEIENQNSIQGTILGFLMEPLLNI